MRCIQEEKSEAAKSSMLDYLGNLMEDATDFSAKASHAIDSQIWRWIAYCGQKLINWTVSGELMLKDIVPQDNLMLKINYVTMSVRNINSEDSQLKQVTASALWQ